MTCSRFTKEKNFAQASVEIAVLKNCRIWLIFFLIILSLSLTFALKPTIGFLVFCFLSILIVMGLEPKLILPFLIFSVIFQDLQFRIMGVAVTLHRTLLILGLILFFSHRLLSGRRVWFKKTMLDTPILLVIISVLFSMINAQDVIKSFQGLFAYLVAFLSFYYVFENLDSLRKINKVISVIFVSTFIIVTYGLYQEVLFRVYGVSTNQIFLFLTHYLQLPWHLIENNSLFTFRGFVRVSSLFRDPNVLAGYLVYLFPLFFSIGLYRLKNRMASGRILVLAFLTFITIILTFSRSGWIGLIISIVFFLFFFRDRIRRSVIAFFLIMCFLGLLFIVPPKIFTERILPTQNLESDPSAFVHYTAYKIAVKAFLSHPMVGIGLNNFGEFFNNVSRLWWKHPIKMMPHSLYLGFLAETGILGFLANIYLLIVIALKLYKTSKLKSISEYEGFIIIGFLCGFIGILAGQIFYQYYTREFLWPLVGVSMATCSLIEREDQFLGKNKDPK